MKRLSVLMVICLVSLLILPTVLAFDFSSVLTSIKDFFGTLLQFGVGCQFVIPQFGRVECEPIAHSKTYTEVTFDAKDHRSDSIIVICGDDENTPQCGPVSVYCKDSDHFAFQHETAQGGWCKINNQENNWCTASVGKSSDTEFMAVFELGSQFRIGGCYNDYIVYKTWKEGNVKNYFMPYGLNVYDSGGKYRYHVESCSLKDMIDWNNLCREGECGVAYTTVRLNFDDWVNYLSSWVYAPEDINNKIVTYQGKEAYCQVNAIYEIAEFKTNDNCYRFPKMKIASVDCCPGMQSANAECGSDFLWHPIIVGECDASRPCSSGYTCVDNECVRISECISDMECPGQGTWLIDTTTVDTDVVRWGCRDNLCQVIERKLTECVPPAIGCPAGMVCDPQTFKCIKQVGPVVECGDGICSKPYENVDNCPEDCKIEFPFNLVIASIMGLIGLILPPIFMKKKLKAILIGLLLGAILFFLFYYVLTYIVQMAFGGVPIECLLSGYYKKGSSAYTCSADYCMEGTSRIDTGSCQGGYYSSLRVYTRGQVIPASEYDCVALYSCPAPTTTVTTTIPITPTTVPTCDRGWTGETRCSDNNVERVFKYEDCSTEWKVYESCVYGCSGGQCLTQTPTTTTPYDTTTTIPGEIPEPNKPTGILQILDTLFRSFFDWLRGIFGFSMFSIQTQSDSVYPDETYSKTFLLTNTLPYNIPDTSYTDGSRSWSYICHKIYDASGNVMEENCRDVIMPSGSTQEYSVSWYVPRTAGNKYYIAVILAEIKKEFNREYGTWTQLDPVEIDKQAIELDVIGITEPTEPSPLDTFVNMFKSFWNWLLDWFR